MNILGFSYEGVGLGGCIVVNFIECFIFGGILIVLGGSSGINRYGSLGIVYIDVNVGEEFYCMI